MATPRQRTNSLYISVFTLYLTPDQRPPAGRGHRTLVLSVTGVENRYNSPKTYISNCRSGHYGFTYGRRHVKTTAQHVCAHCAMHCGSKKLNEGGKMAESYPVMSDTDVHIWINIHLQRFIMSIKIRRTIHKTTWKTCNDVKGLGHV